VIGRPEIAPHPDYATNALRVQNREVLEPLIAEIFLTDTASRWAERLLAAGVPCSPVRTLEEVYQDPQSAVRQMFVSRGAGGFPVTGLPVKMPAAGEVNREAAPLLGEHSCEALRELLQYEDDAIGDLLKNRILIQA
jgi:crotonobetainyl-CoA:carnitine CoA-transferase CaiB-like acyl-CoA transferase